MQLDECVALPCAYARAEEAMELSLRWAERCKRAFDEGSGAALFGIVQGGSEPGLRARSLEGLIGIGFHGYAVGGLAVGEPQDVMFKVLDETVPGLPHERPRYLMGVGTPDDIVGAVSRGIDMFDCVMPTRAAGMARPIPASGASTFATRATGTIRARSTRRVRARPRGSIRAPTCITWCVAASRLARCC